MSRMPALRLFLLVPPLLAAAGCASLVPAAGRGEPAVQQLVAEDDGARIDELRVRGQTQRLAVTPKLPGAPAYEILPSNRGQDSAQSRGAAGQRVWPLLSF